MELAMVGLGRMGMNMAIRLLRGKHRVIGYDLNEASIQATEAEGAEAARSLEEIRDKLPAPRITWVMVPSGEPTEETIGDLAEVLETGDIIIDGGNSNYKDSVRRATMLKEKELHFVDVGTSGGIWGLAEGYSMMVGGEKAVVEQLSPIFETLAPDANKGWGYVGPSGAGHFVKMVHNGIEYGLMQAYAEGFEILKARREFGLDLHQIAEIWRYGSVVRSWLLDLTAQALAEDQELSAIEDWVSDSGEGRWIVADSIDLDVPAPVITLSLLMRLVSRQKESYAAKVLAAMRHRFGGHEARPKRGFPR
jgi:6-phosphogluconate dehydrogenase